MALPPSGTTDEAFLREVDEEYRRAQMLSIWQRYGKLIIGAVVLALAAFAGFLFWQHQTASAAGQRGEQYDSALREIEQNQLDKAGPDLAKLSAKGGDGFAAMSAIVEGNLALQKKDAKGAVAKFAAVATNSAYPKTFRDYALLRQTVAEYDSLKPEVVVSRLQGLAKPDSAWFGSAGELVATAQIKLGKRAEAGKLLQQIAQGGENVPETTRQRAVQLASVLGIDVLGQSKEKQAQ
ncbi:tetratricopeptide repeat protein [Sphingomonas sp. HITSZ_GF]|uniref:tetratricopeptide repeat protein n=1 Tax=Sphingomonas sp. HITSZ_GF TaxID=3037247 RepID=UPI00240DEA37|nr:tetratricopeptide repeat protein [Sphingomonas sp. HITSZ_GF]MDG2534877.1 tetratricopeptide repeat protein [Sphingomonas sp. HITSZ_GF]